MNVILQSLSSSHKVTDWLINNRSTSSLSVANKTNSTKNSASLFDTLASIVAKINRIDLFNFSDTSDAKNKKLNDQDADEFEFYAAHDVKRALNAHNWQIHSEEHDCHELFHLIMDVLDEEQKENKISLTSLNYFMPSSLKRNATKNPFHGYFISQLTCLDCDYKYPLRLESFYSLPLTLPQAMSQSSKMFSNLMESLSNNVTLYQCINNFFKPEHISEMKCENCSKNPSEGVKKRGFIKRQAIAKLPDCLCIQIQRNSWSDSNFEMIKQTSYVQFPLSIKIDSAKSNVQQHFINKSQSEFEHIYDYRQNAQFSLKQVGIGGLVGGKSANNSLRNSRQELNKLAQSPPTMHEFKYIYELKSAVVHYGSAHSGHFVVFRKPLSNSKSDDWLQISDSDIKRIKQTNLLNSNVYMLFYDKVLTNNLS